MNLFKFIFLLIVLILNSFFVNLVFASSSNITQINFTTTPQTINLNTVSAVISIQTQNINGILEQTSETNHLNLTSTSPTGEFSSNSTNWVPVNTLTMSTGTANKNFYYKDSTAGNYTLTALISGQTWSPASSSITIVGPLSSDKTISSFNFDSIPAIGIIDENIHSVSILVPEGTDISNLTPNILVTGASISPLSGVSTDFTNPVVYTVTAADSSTIDYTVTVSVAPPVLPDPVVIPDTIAPTITINGLDNISIDFDSIYVDAGAIAIDDIDTNVPVESTGSVNANTAGVYEIVYNATDSSGNISTASRTVTVKPKKTVVVQFHPRMQIQNLPIVENTIAKEQIPVVPVVAKSIENAQNPENKTLKKIVYLDKKSITTDFVSPVEPKNKKNNSSSLGASAADSIYKLSIWGEVRSFFKWILGR